MGSGLWNTSSFRDYSSARGMSVNLDGSITGTYSNQDIFKSKTISDKLSPFDVIRECCDSDEHPKTRPVILALDVTGSMGEAAVEIAKKLNVIMTQLYEKVEDVEFMIMGIGDLSYDSCPIQISQFESDIRIAEQLDKVYFEFGGGGNFFESYTAAWYMGSRHTKLDCWNRGERGVIITIGDERLNPYLPSDNLSHVTGDLLQSNIETKDLYNEVVEKYDVYHLDVKHNYGWDADNIKKSFMEYLDDNHFRRVNMDNIADEIVDIVLCGFKIQDDKTNNSALPEEGISW